jgi:hypothetical protein
MIDKHDHWPFKKRYGLKDIPIGEDTLEVLNDLPMWFTKEESYKNLFLGYEDQKHRRDHWTGEELRLQIMKSERSHEGFPDCLHGYSFGTTNIKFAPDIPIDDLVSVAQRTNHKKKSLNFRPILDSKRTHCFVCIHQVALYLGIIMQMLLHITSSLLGQRKVKVGLNTGTQRKRRLSHFKTKQDGSVRQDTSVLMLKAMMGCATMLLQQTV